MEYYDIRGRFTSDWACAELITDWTGIDVSKKEAYCPICGRSVTITPSITPCEFRIKSQKLADILWCALPNMLISQRFWNLYCQEKLTGIREVRKVRIFYRGKEIEEQYYYPLYHYSQKAIEYALKQNHKATYKTGCALCEHDSYNNEEKYRQYFNNIVEYDLFHVYDRPGRLYCNNRFVEFCSKYQIKNIAEYMVPSDTYLLEFCLKNKDRFHPRVF